MKSKKHGKSQQSLVMQMIYWKNLKMTKGMTFTKFIEQQKNKSEFFFAPFVIDGESLKVIDELKILKIDFKVKGCSELKPSEMEYHFK